MKSAFVLTCGLVSMLACAPANTGSDGADGTAKVAEAPTFDATVDSSFIVVPGVRIGPVNSRTSEADLIAIFGDRNVRQHTIYLAEGFCTLGTRVLAGTPDELQIAWRDSARTRIAVARIEGEGSRWHTSSGVRIGTTLKQLEEISGEVHEFTGFGGELGGTCPWGEPGETVKALGLKLDPDDALENSQHPKRGEVYGVEAVRSDHPVFETGSAVVRKIYQNWGWPYVELDCF